MFEGGRRRVALKAAKVALSTGVVASGALAVGALAVGAFAVGALAVGTLAIGRLKVMESRSAGDRNTQRDRLEVKSRG